LARLFTTKPVQDARGFLQEKLEDLDGELYEPEEPK
jgi:hypothetical protein